jgi:hypothetical protein
MHKTPKSEMLCLMHLHHNLLRWSLADKLPSPSKVSLDKWETVSLGTSGNQKLKACSNTMIWGAMGEIEYIQNKDSYNAILSVDPPSSAIC